MFKIFFLAFLIVPLTELYVLIQVGAAVGAITTIALCLFTAALGAFLLRLQGIETMKRVQSRLREGEMPAEDLVGGFILLVSGVLLLTPGFMTDIAGFLCLVPGLRMGIANWVLARLLVHHRQSRHKTIIIEGEFWDEENKQLKGNDDDGQL